MYTRVSSTQTTTIMSDPTTLPSQSGDVLVGSEIDYTRKIVEHGSYEWTKILPITGGQQVALSATSTAETMFEIPTKMINFARSHLTFDLGFQAPAANIANFIHADGLPMIDRLSLYTRSGVYLCDINNYNYFSKMTTKYTTDMDDFLQRDIAIAGSTIIGSAAGTSSSTSASGLQPCNSKAANSWQGSSYAASDNVSANGAFTANAAAPIGLPNPAVGPPVAASVVTPADLGNYIRSVFSCYTALKAINGNFRPQNGAHGTLDTVEPRYLINNKPAANTIAALATYLHFDITLGNLAHTIFALDKGIFFGEVLIVRINWAPTNKIGFKGVVTTPVAAPGGADPTAAYITFPHPGATVTALVPVANSCVDNLTMYLAVETSRDIINEFIAKMQSGGVKLLCPFAYNLKQTTPNSTNASVQQRLNTGHGRRLLHAYFSSFTNGGVDNLAYDNYNQTSRTDDTAAKINSFYTSLDNQRIQQYSLRPAYLEDYMLMKPLLKNCPVSTADIYRASWTYVDSFCGKPLSEAKQTDFYQNGIDLSTERLYSVFVDGQTAAVYDYYMAFVCQKELVIAPNMIAMM